MLLSQSIELYLKSRIYEINPLLIVNLRNADVSCDFADLQNIDAKDLLSLHEMLLEGKVCWY